MAKVVNIKDSVTLDQSPKAIDAERKKAAQEKLQRLIKEETKTVRGVFQNYENPGGGLTICVKKYAQVPMFQLYMTDGQEYEIPLYVARHLNGIDAVAEHINGKVNTCAYPVHGFHMQSKEAALNPSTLGVGAGREVGIPVPIVGVSKWKRRFGFQSMEFAGAING